MSQISAPRTAVVHNHRVGKPIEAKCFGQRWLDRLSCLVRQSFKAQVTARVIVQDGQCLSRATHRGQWPFEIHLPKTIGHLTLETVPVGLGRLTASIDQPMTVKDSGDGARGRQSLFILILQKTTDLARSPAWISTTQRYQGLFFSLSQLTGTFLGTTRMIGETFASLLTVSVQPLVAGFPTDAITLAQLRKAHRFFLRQSHKLLAQRHETNHSPRHKLSPLSISGRTMPLVTEKVLPMSPVHLLPMSPVYTARETFHPTLATHAIYHNINATLAGQPSHFFREIRCFVIDAALSAKLLGPRELFIAAGSDDNLGTHMGGDLQCRRSHPAADAENQHILAGLDDRVGHQHSPNSNVHERKRRRFFAREMSGNRTTVPCRHSHVFSVGAVLFFSDNAQLSAHKLTIGDT